MNIALANFQLNTIKKLLECMENDTVHNIILKSPTGSGKTIILTHFIDEYLKSHSNTIFI
jgi:type III restriction enzyme